MAGAIVGPMSFQLGNSCFEGDAYVAPIEDDMLLGADFLHAKGVVLDLKSARLELGEEQIPLQFGSDLSEHKVARVRAEYRVIVPPNKAKRVSGILDQKLDTFVFEPVHTLEGIAPQTLHDAGATAEIYVINLADRPVIIDPGDLLGAAQEVEVAKVPYDPTEDGLSSAQGSELLNLLVYHADAFAKDEFDLGNFTLIEHGIDTGTSPPIKQRMRRTPVAFAGEEKAHLAKVENAGVIQPSISEWASAPVLVRKRDGGVRWCIDYRASTTGHLNR
ncbi:uncharacterized protein LOC121415425 [Lytechinus variegatus]|uniref:uncharacterized protein LOC121415425 n=1 Tax=Lytechinus variegatus TaxID=7654 RepID=UPI001BB0D9E5|nr:uncharacterized protein LOC121415425 [Lytechinus variegatus]